ncbi:ATP-grasp domain-containing protein [Jiulongibacter sediminis]|uniref:Glutathione synthase n=1 Tax=Jiulongibacter sediminis TaxID=1605367 RepID=A0A0P7CAJ4_9BACT|nr:glutathione synthase [Jiulongibacter sediminis]KPM49693.1 glutathione synthase [Jiulongibacter sediminis]TBX26733.1 glutathione synthase [Jiulongibacter sediminis]
MKKIGILFGMENTFPYALIEHINELTGKKGIIAEPVLIGKVNHSDPTEYDVIIDRISHEVPFYRAYLKNAALHGTSVINNPFWWSADEKFFNNCLAAKLGIPVPKTVLLPSKERPDDTSETTFRNLKFPMEWEEMFSHIGFPAYMKPHAGGGWRSIYRVTGIDDLWAKHESTGQLVMMLQEEIEFTDYFRCYCIDQKHVHIMPYEPRNPRHLRYATQPASSGPSLKKLLKKIEEYTLAINKALGYDFNAVEFAVKDGVPYAIDLCNPSPDADSYSVGSENFTWVVDQVAKMAIERAKNVKPGVNNCTWGTFLQNSITPSDIAKVAGKKVTPRTKTAASKK